MTAPAPPSDPQPTGKTALSDPENVGWVEEKATEKLDQDAAYWRMRGMIPPAKIELEE